MAPLLLQQQKMYTLQAVALQAKRASRDQGNILCRGDLSSSRECGITFNIPVSMCLLPVP